MSENETTGPIGLHELSPAPGSRRPRKRIGRGTGSGTGKTSGRGQKGQKSRSGSHMMRAGFEGGQNPLYMLLGKQRGPHKKTSMPFGPFRTQTTGVNLRDIARRFESGADVTPELMLAARVVRTLRHPVKVLGVGEVPGPLNVRAHGFSASARQKIEAAGGTATVIEELVVPDKPAAAAKPAVVEDVAVEDVAVEDVAVEDVAVEDVAVEDVAVEDVAVEETQPAADEAPGDEAEA
jgi:large subunit ribosomal protein L15